MGRSSFFTAFYAFALQLSIVFFMAGGIHSFSIDFAYLAMRPNADQSSSLASFLVRRSYSVLVGFLPSCIRAEIYCRIANNQFKELAIVLEKNPDEPLTQASIDAANHAFGYTLKMWKASRDYAVVALVFLTVITIGSILTGYQINMRASRRYTQIKVAEKEDRSTAHTQEIASEPLPLDEIHFCETESENMGRKLRPFPSILRTDSSCSEEEAIESITNKHAGIKALLHNFNNQQNLQENVAEMAIALQKCHSGCENEIKGSNSSPYRHITGERRARWSNLSYKRLF